MRNARFRVLAVAQLARQAIREYVPAPLWPVLSACGLRVKDCPDAEDIARGAPPDARGYFFAEVDESQTEGFDPGIELGGVRPQIVIFARNVPAELDAVAKVVLHELAHAMGADEFEVEGMGLG